MMPNLWEEDPVSSPPARRALPRHRCLCQDNQWEEPGASVAWRREKKKKGRYCLPITTSPGATNRGKRERARLRPGEVGAAWEPLD